MEYPLRHMVIQLPIVPKSLLKTHLLYTCVKCHGACKAERHTFFIAKCLLCRLKSRHLPIHTGREILYGI